MTIDKTQLDTAGIIAEHLAHAIAHSYLLGPNGPDSIEHGCALSEALSQLQHDYPHIEDNVDKILPEWNGKTEA